MSYNFNIKNADGNFDGYLALPSNDFGPGIIVIQEIFGVNGFMRDVADGLATQGFVALVPDLFWRIEPHIQLTDQSEAEWKRAFELYTAFDVDKGVEDIAASIAGLRAHPAVTGKVGCVGFCLGGLLAYLTAARTDCDASVSYYGVGIEGKLGEIKAVKKPLMMHVAQEDRFVSKEAQAVITIAAQQNPLVTVHSYADRDHAFARVGGAHYHAADAKHAGERSLAFLKENLG